MDNEKKQFDVQNALKLLAPREGTTPMVPLSEMEQPQSTLFWAAIFFGLFSALLGSMISLLTTSYQNYPVIYILVLTMVSYLCFFTVFTVRGFNRRNQVKKRALEPDLSEPNTVLERLAALENRVQSLKVHRDLRTHVFKKQRTLELKEFNRKIDELLPFEPDDPRRQKFNQKLLAEGIIVIDKTDEDNLTVTFEDEFDEGF